MINVHDNAETATNSKKNNTSILDIDLIESLSVPYADILDSPRTLEAMNNLGILPSELDDASYETVRVQL